jgi:hypothetical protein
LGLRRIRRQDAGTSQHQSKTNRTMASPPLRFRLNQHVQPLLPPLFPGRFLQWNLFLIRTLKSRLR